MPEQKENLLQDNGKFNVVLIVNIILILISIIFVIFRIIMYFFDLPYLLELSKDFDYRLLMEGMNNGLINFYGPTLFPQYQVYYLYYWYFMFFPMSLLPIEVGVFIWDGLRLICCIYVIKKAPLILGKNIDLYIFYVFVIYSYFQSAWFNNVNFIVLFLLFCSYYALEKDKKWLAGILFALAAFKINSLIFLPIILIVKKIKIKDLIYFLLPLFLLCIPYIIFPEYFISMIGNLGTSQEPIVQTDSAILNTLKLIDNVLWKAMQPTHLMYISLIIAIFLINIKDLKWRKRYRIILISFLSIYTAYQYIFLGAVPVFSGNVTI